MIKKLLTAGLLMGSLLSFSHATCWVPNCYGAIGFDPKTGNGAAYVDYTSANEAWRAVVKKCPGCENSKGLTFNNGCGVLVYSPSHDFVVSYYGGQLRDLEIQAVNACYSEIRATGLNKTSGDKRRSRVRTNESGTCEVVVSACTYRVY